MAPRPRLTHLAGIAAVVLSLAVPALAADGATGQASEAAPAYENAAPLADEGDGTRALGKTAPAEQQVTPPAPSDCPFRDGKLELIV